MTHEDFILGLCGEFELAFLATGLKPLRRSFGDGISTGCMVTALDVGEHGNAKLPPPQERFWAALKQGFALMARDAGRVRRVRKRLAAEHVEFDQRWWAVFVRYCMMTFDGHVTFPLRWMRRNCHEPVRGRESPKLMGAAVGGLVQRHVFSAPGRENQVCRAEGAGRAKGPRRARPAQVSPVMEKRVERGDGAFPARQGQPAGWRRSVRNNPQSPLTLLPHDCR
jgi:hypothetical protein